ncbi:MAG2-interacting protein [Salix suchowensis]|nr:MAG2-interacting protein [Salix suchowensis]
MRINKRQLRASSSIVGLIPQDGDDNDAQRSCLCRFVVITADGCLHLIETSKEPSASVLNSGLKSLGKFPKDVFCVDYSSECSLLVVVGSAVGISQSSVGNSAGSCLLSLWCRSQNLDLEPLISIQFEGLYSKSKDAALSCPKVLISPQGKYVATLDIRGCLHIFKMDKESRSLLSFACEEQLCSQGSNNITNEQNELLKDIVDFTWWSDRIMTLAKHGGILAMLDIGTGLKFQEHDHLYSMLVLDRIQQFQGRIFVLDSKVPSKPHRESGNVYNVEQITGGRNDQLDVSQLHWSLISVSKRSVPEMYNILISNCKYQAALDFANHHGLDGEEVLKSQWLHSGHGKDGINMFLSNIKDRNFVLSECVDKVGPTEDAVKALLSYGLQVTDQFRFSESEADEGNQIWHFRMARLQLLQFRDRLETYMGINMGRFSVQEYCKFRIIPVGEAAITLAESGKIGALNLLFKRHPYSLSPSLLKILAAIPETVPLQTYGQLLPGRSPPPRIALREEDWVECEEMVNFINRLPENHEIGTQIQTEPIVKRCLGYLWPSSSELSEWYKNRARDIDSFSGQLDNCINLIDLACHKGIYELQKFHEDILYLHQLIYSDENDVDVCSSMSLISWEQLSDYEKFRMMLKGAKEENVVKRLHDKAIPFMRKRFHNMTYFTQDQDTDSFLVKWLKEIALENKLDTCLMVFEEGCRELHMNDFFKDEIEAVDCALQCIYLCTVTDRWSIMAALLSKLPQKQDVGISIECFEKRLKLAEGHIEAGRLLALYQVPKPMDFFLEAHSDEKGVKQILRLILSKFVRRQPSRSDNDWANMWRDVQCLREKAFPFLDLEYMLVEFCRGLLKAGKFSLARNYLKGTSSVSLASEKAENLVIQAAREYFFSASSLSCSEIWKAKECLNLFPSSRNVQTEIDIIDALTIKLPYLGVTLLPMQFRQIKEPIEIIKMAITSQAGAYLHVDELIEVAKLLGLNSSEDISTVQEAIAREAAVAGDLQLAFDLCLVLAKKGHGHVWDLCAAIARGPALENIDIGSRKHLLGFALSHCDEESIGELLHAWKDLDMQGQCETLSILTGTSPSSVSDQGSSITSPPAHGIEETINLKDYSGLVGGASCGDREVCFSNIKNTLSMVTKNCHVDGGTDLESFLWENGKLLSFATFQLPWLLELSKKADNGKKFSSLIPGKHYVSIRTQAVVTILSWLAKNDFAPRDDVIASLAKSIIEPPVTKEEDIIGCSFLLNLVGAFNGVEIIEEQLRIRGNYQEICSIMNVGMTYSLLHNSGVECKGPAQRRELLRRKFKEKHKPPGSDEMTKIDEVQSTFWREWKFKLEEKKRVAEQSRELEKIIPGVETGRFLSGDLDYIKSAIFSLIESVKFEKKHIIRDVLKLVNAYGLNHAEVLLRYLSSILVSEVWTDDDVKAEISEVKGEIIRFGSETIKIISLVVYPTIDGCNKQRLAFIYGLLSDCYLRLGKSKKSLSTAHRNSPNLSALDAARLYKVFEQECQRVSFIKNLDFKNVAGLDGLNLQSFQNEVFSHVNEFSLEALAKMVQALASIYADSPPEGLIVWQDVYKHYTLSLLTTLESRVRTECDDQNAERFQEFMSQLEKTYDFCRTYIRLLSPSDSLDIMKRYFTVIIPLHSFREIIPDNSTWQDCIIVLLNFWLKLTEEMQEIALNESSVGTLRFDPEFLSSCLKAFMRMVMEDSVSPSHAWGTVIGYASSGLTGDFSVEIPIFCRAMLYSGCGFGAISEVFLEAMSICVTTPASTAKNESLDLPQLYVNMLELILRNLVGGSHEHQNLYHLLSSLSKLEGQIEDLQRVRHVVWERMVQFSDNLELPSHVRVHVLEIMQFITGRSIKGFSTELESNLLPWEGWDGLLSTGKKSDLSANQGSSDHTDNSSRFTSTLVALKSSQLASAISPSIEITPDDLFNVETAASCFLKLCEFSSTEPHFGALIGIIEEWEGFFATAKDELDTKEATETGNDWNNDDWDEGWESFQEVEALEKEKPENSNQVHPLHVCWMEIFKKLVSLSRFKDVLRLIDRSLSKSYGTLLDEDDARSLSHTVLEKDSFIALKMVLLLPYEAIQLQCLDVAEVKLKQGGISEILGRDHEILMLVLSSGVISNIITKPSYGATFSYLCYVVGNFSRQSQEAELPGIANKGTNERVNIEKDVLLLFRRILFPCFISELVRAGQQILAGFLITKFMHTNPSLSLINTTESSLSRYLERQLHALEQGDDYFTVEETGSCEMFRNAVSRLTIKLGDEMRSALPLLSSNAT